MQEEDVTNAIDGADNQSATPGGAHSAGKRHLFALPVELRHLKRPTNVS